MDLGVVVLFVLLLAGGVVLGTALSVLRPRDEEAARYHRQVAARAAGLLRRGRRG